LLNARFAKRGDGPNLFPDFRNWPTLLAEMERRSLLILTVKSTLRVLVVDALSEQSHPNTSSTALIALKDQVWHGIKTWLPNNGLAGGGFVPTASQAKERK